MPRDLPPGSLTCRSILLIHADVEAGLLKLLLHINPALLD
jgi:hypothetical protein